MYTSKKIIQVEAVRIADRVAPVRFKINTTSQTVKAKTPGKPPIRIHCEGEKFFHATMDGKKTVVVGGNARVTFAKAVKKFWK